jgi:Mg-chelatase subunit ChlD
MINPWYCATLLALEASDVMRLRMTRIAFGGGEAFSEVHLMMTEKIGAAVEALSSMMFGGTPLSVIERYREHVAANACRLTEA